MTIIKIEAALVAAQAELAKLANTCETKLESQLLLQHLLNVNCTWLIAHQNDALETNIHATYRALVNRRIKGEPIAYILGTREFYGLKLNVTADTLIPRPDTETLVDAALAKISPQKNLGVCDLGTGSGAIALAIAKHRPDVSVTATDASQAALDVAIENAQNLQLANVKFVLSDWFSALNDEKFDLIVSNPPYIEQQDIHLKQGDLRFEPLSALASGQDGLDDIRKIVAQAPLHLNPHGYLMLEHGYNQAEAVAALLKVAGFTEIETLKDLGGNDRVTIGKNYQSTF